MREEKTEVKAISVAKGKGEKEAGREMTREERIKRYEEIARQRKLVIPGEELGEGRAGQGCYVEGGKVYAKVLGLLERRGNTFFIIPLNGVYNPRKGDNVIGIIKEISISRWIVDINSPYLAILSISEAVDEFIDLTRADLTRYYDIGDVIFARVLNVTKAKLIQLTMKARHCKKLRGGRLIKITPTKVPRVIGKGGSMVELIKRKTGCSIVIGQNGLIWIRGANSDIAAEAIFKIERYAHKVGLTDKIAEFLDRRLAERSRK